MSGHIIYELFGKKHLLVEVIFTTGTTKRITAAMEKFNCIYQWVKEVHRGWFFSESYIIMKILVPEESIIGFNAET